MEEFQVVWTEPAIADLDGIIAHLERQGSSTAERTKSEILEHVKILSSFPFIGPRYERDRRGRSREIVYRHYRIFYRVIEEAKRVEILTIWHGARQEPKSLP